MNEQSHSTFFEKIWRYIIKHRGRIDKISKEDFENAKASIINKCTQISLALNPDFLTENNKNDESNVYKDIQLIFRNTIPKVIENIFIQCNSNNITNIISFQNYQILVEFIKNNQCNENDLCQIITVIANHANQCYVYGYIFLFFSNFFYSWNKKKQNTNKTKL